MGGRWQDPVRLRPRALGGRGSPLSRSKVRCAMMLGVLTITGKGKAGSALYSASVAGGGTCAWPGVGVRGGAGQLARRTLMDPYFSRCADFLIRRAFSLWLSRAKQTQRFLLAHAGIFLMPRGDLEFVCVCVCKGLHLSPW